MPWAHHVNMRTDLWQPSRLKPSQVSSLKSQSISVVRSHFWGFSGSKHSEVLYTVNGVHGLPGPRSHFGCLHLPWKMTSLKIKNVKTNKLMRYEISLLNMSNNYIFTFLLRILFYQHIQEKLIGSSGSCTLLLFQKLLLCPPGDLALLVPLLIVLHSQPSCYFQLVLLHPD